MACTSPDSVSQSVRSSSQGLDEKLPCGALTLHNMYFERDLPAVDFLGFGDQGVKMDFKGGVVRESNIHSGNTSPVFVYRRRASKRDPSHSPLVRGRAR